MRPCEEKARYAPILEPPLVPVAVTYDMIIGLVLSALHPDAVAVTMIIDFEDTPGFTARRSFR